MSITREQMGNMGQVEAVILDVDGTLVDSNTAHSQSWTDTFQAAGIDVSVEFVQSLIGMGSDRLIPRVTGRQVTSDLGKRLTEDRSLRFRKSYLPGIRAFPKVRDLLLRFRDAGVRLTVATSAEPQELKHLLELAQISDLLESSTTSGDVERSKPDPDIIQAALASLGTRPEATLMLGDTPYDVEAAGMAGIRTVAVRCGGWDDHQLVGALAIFKDTAELLSKFESSPFSGSYVAPST